MDVSEWFFEIGWFLSVDLPWREQAGLDNFIYNLDPPMAGDKFFVHMLNGFR